MALTADKIAQGCAWLARQEPGFQSLLAQVGPPPPRVRTPGYETLLHTIVSQQVSTAAAASIWRKVQSCLGDTNDPARLLDTPFEDLRAAGLSRMKITYACSLAEHVLNGRLPITQMPADTEAAIALLTDVRGIGRWSAEIYLLFAEGRPDVFPAGDLAVQVQAGRLFLDGIRPSEKQLRQMARNWSPWRGVAALLLWHGYKAPPL